MLHSHGLGVSTLRQQSLGINGHLNLFQRLHLLATHFEADVQRDHAVVFGGLFVQVLIGQSLFSLGVFFAALVNHGRLQLGVHRQRTFRYFHSNSNAVHAFHHSGEFLGFGIQFNSLFRRGQALHTQSVIRQSILAQGFQSSNLLFSQLVHSLHEGFVILNGHQLIQQGLTVDGRLLSSRRSLGGNRSLTGQWAGAGSRSRTGRRALAGLSTGVRSLGGFRSRGRLGTGLLAGNSGSLGSLGRLSGRLCCGFHGGLHALDRSLDGRSLLFRHDYFVLRDIVLHNRGFFHLHLAGTVGDLTGRLGEGAIRHDAADHHHRQRHAE